MLIKDCVAFVLGTGAFYQCIFVKPIDIRPPLTKTKDRQSFINILTKKNKSNVHTYTFDIGAPPLNGIHINNY